MPNNKPTAKLLPLNRETYAEERKLPLKYLVEKWGLKNVIHDTVGCVEQPYTRMDGTVCAPRYRYANAKKSPVGCGDSIILYGQSQLISKELSAFTNDHYVPVAEEKVVGGKKQVTLRKELVPKREDHCILVEGESCTQTLRYAGYNVLGIPGTSMWDKCIANDPPILKFLEVRTLVVIQEPPSPAEEAKGLNSPAKMIAKIRATLPNAKVVAVKLWEFAPRDEDGKPLYKDASGLWMYHGGDSDKFREAMHIAVRSAAKKSGVPHRAIEFICAASVEMKLTKYLWPNRIPLNKVSVFSGLGERGKSTVAADFVSRLTTSTDFPDCKNTNLPCDVLVLASEEDYDEDICPRLTAAGADMNRVFFAERSTVDGGEAWPIALDRDLSLLQEKLAQHPNVKLVVVDPVTSYVGEVDPGKPKEVRPFIDKLKAFAKAANVSILLVMHFSKNPDVAAIHKTSGAATWTDQPRAVWMFDKKKDEADSTFPRTHVMVAGKLNKKASDQKRTLEFTFGGVPVLIEDKLEEVGVVQWGQETDLTMEQQFKGEEKQKPGPAPKKKEAAKKWLSKYLANGPKSNDDVFKDGDAAGHNEWTLRDAKKEMGITHEPTDGVYVWKLPEKDAFGTGADGDVY